MKNSGSDIYIRNITPAALEEYLDYRDTPPVLGEDPSLARVGNEQELVPAVLRDLHQDGVFEVWMRDVWVVDTN